MTSTTAADIDAIIRDSVDARAAWIAALRRMETFTAADSIVGYRAAMEVVAARDRMNDADRQVRRLGWAAYR